MRAMILAAGRGERMRPLTDRTPKPLLEVGGETLLGRHLDRLARAGVREAVVNNAYLGDLVRAFVGDGGRWGLQVRHSIEPSGALDTGGGVREALPLLGEDPFVLVNSDIWTEFDFETLKRRLDDRLAHLILVPNPEHHPGGDFALREGMVQREGEKFTYAGIALIHPKLLLAHPRGKFPLAPILKSAIRSGQVSGELFRGHWCDVGTPERLLEANLLARDAQRVSR